MHPRLYTAERSTVSSRTAPLALSGLALALLAACGGGGGTPPLPALSALTAEPGFAGSPVRFQMTLEHAHVSAASMSVSTANIGAPTTDQADGFARGGDSCATPDVDYVAVSRSISVAAGTTAVTVDVQTCANTTLEANERFALDVTWNGRTQRVEGLIVNNAPGGLNDTGVTRCLNSAGALVECGATDLAGQDGTTGRDVRPLTASAADGRAGFSYAASTPACVTDNVTGLSWASAVESASSWSTLPALATQANNEARCGFTDWRVPTTQELLSLVDAGAAAGAARIDATFFPGAQAQDLWSADTRAANTNEAWRVSFAEGLSDFLDKSASSTPAFTRLVRGGNDQADACTDDPDHPRYIDHQDGTVTDTRTGLMWQRCADGLSGSDCSAGTATVHGSFAAALQRAAQVNADVSGTGRGRSDWRVPNRNELASLVQTACAAPAINRTAFPGTPATTTGTTTLGVFWSSTPAGDDLAWKVDFIDGQVLPARPSGAGLLRLVRAGH